MEVYFSSYKAKGNDLLVEKKKIVLCLSTVLFLLFFHLDSTKEITNYVFFRSVKVLSSSLELFMLERLTSQC